MFFDFVAFSSTPHIYKLLCSVGGRIDYDYGKDAMSSLKFEIRIPSVIFECVDDVSDESTVRC